MWLGKTWKFALVTVEGRSLFRSVAVYIICTLTDDGVQTCVVLQILFQNIILPNVELYSEFNR